MTEYASLAARWDRFFLALCDANARMSKDPSTQVGAVIVRPDNTVASMGWNGLPRRVFDRPGRYADRTQKLAMTIHAELNAILSAKEPLRLHTLYVTPLFPCSNCAAAIIQSGITHIRYEMPDELPERWRTSFELSKTMFDEAGVTHLALRRG